MRDDRERLLDIQEAISKIEKYMPSRDARHTTKMNLIQNWIVHHLQIIPPPDHWGSGTKHAPRLSAATRRLGLVKNHRNA